MTPKNAEEVAKVALDGLLSRLPSPLSRADESQGARLNQYAIDVTSEELGKLDEAIGLLADKLIEVGATEYGELEIPRAADQACVARSPGMSCRVVGGYLLYHANPRLSGQFVFNISVLVR